MTPQTYPQATRWEPDDTKETPLREIPNPEPRAKPLPRKNDAPRSKRKPKQRDLEVIAQRLKERHLLAVTDDFAAKHFVTRAELLDGREPHMVKARAKLWQWLSKRNWANTSIGKLFGYDAATVWHAVSEQ